MLEYNEFQKGRKITINFDKICPFSSRTIQNHVCEQKKSLSIVAFFNDDDFTKLIKDEINNKIEKLKYNFVPIERLHCTFLGISSSDYIFKKNLNDYFIKLIQKAIKDFFEERKVNGHTTNFQLKFDEIRPGTWHGFDNIKFQMLVMELWSQLGIPIQMEIKIL